MSRDQKLEPQTKREQQWECGVEEEEAEEEEAK